MRVSCVLHARSHANLKGALNLFRDDDAHVGDQASRIDPAQCRYNECEHLSVTGGERLLAPGASTSIDIAFTPREARAYAEKLQVSVLSLSTVRPTPA